MSSFSLKREGWFDKDLSNDKIMDLVINGDEVSKKLDVSFGQTEQNIRDQGKTPKRIRIFVDVSVDEEVEDYYPPDHSF